MKAHLRKHFIEQDIPAHFEQRGEIRHYFAAGGPDVAMVRDYYRAGAPHGEVLYFSIGETWNQIAPGLERLVRLYPPPVDSHGYQLMPYGLPALRRTLERYIAESHEAPAGAFESGLCQTVVSGCGTRAAMYDFGKLVLKYRKPQGTPVFLTTLPGWDYRGVFEPLGYRIAALPLQASQGFRPDLEALDQLVAKTRATDDQTVAIVAINAQHNPTGVNWSESEVRHVVRLALQAGAAILLDDPYFAIHAPDVVPTSALRILLEELRRERLHTPPWLAVRSLGKQFNCNGWAIGAMTSSPETIQILCNEYLFQRTYPYGTSHQAVMAAWLESPESSTFLALQNSAYVERKRFARDWLVNELGFEPADVHTGECTSYMLFRIPAAFRDLPNGSAAFQRAVFERTGVLLGVGSLAPDPERRSNVQEYVRLFVGPAFEQLEEAMVRLKAGGIDATLPR